jgi:DNA (cytosine-5)-methyltransferase 1
VRNDLDSHGAYVAGPITKRYGKGVNTTMDDGAMVAHTLRSEGFDASEDGTGRSTPLTVVRSTGGTHSLEASGDASPALKVGSGVGIPSPPALQQGNAVRRLTPVECERLQNWPDGWTLPDGPSLADEPCFPHRVDDACPPPDGPRYAACGDGVTASVSHWIGARILAWECDRALEEAA